MKIPAWFVGEFLGTFLIVFFGCGSVAAAVLTDAQVGIFQVAIVWGLGIAIAIHLTASLSGAHLNPSVTIAFAVFAGFEKKLVPAYLLTQLAAAFTAAAVIHGMFGSAFVTFESVSEITRGAAGSEASAMVYGEFFPNPGGKALDDPAKESLSIGRAFFTEAVGTAILLLVIFGLTDRRNFSRSRLLTPALIGLTITVLISLIAPLTQAGFNPARDLGPRLFSSLAGWGSVPFATNGHGWWLVYILAPITGGLVGGGLYHLVIGPAFRKAS